jgi:hypothetical protein
MLSIAGWSLDVLGKTMGPRNGNPLYEDYLRHPRLKGLRSPRKRQYKSDYRLAILLAKYIPQC